MPASPDRPIHHDVVDVVEHSPLPLFEDNERFALPYIPEKFTETEGRILRLFFSNTDRPVFVSYGIPEQIIAALSSRYSRARGSLRRMFLDEYIMPILHPERQNGWRSSEITPEGRLEAIDLSHRLRELMRFYERNGDMGKVLNSKRAQEFFEKWLSDYGDDSIAELGGAHVFFEGISNVAANAIETQRVGASYLEKSSRYVEFGRKNEKGEYNFAIPAELEGTPEEVVFVNAMNKLFDLYNKLRVPYLNYIKEKYPQGDDESDEDFNTIRRAKRFDDIRDLLPFATQTNVAVHANGRVFEYMIYRLLSHPSGEMRWLAQQMHKELDTVVPAFMHRPATERGSEIPLYRRDLDDGTAELVDAALDELPVLEAPIHEERQAPHWVELESYDRDADINVCAELLRKSKRHLDRVMTRRKARKLAIEMSPKKRKQLIENVIGLRFQGEPDTPREKVRFRKPPRALERAHYSFDVISRGGDYRDLQRHRIVTHLRTYLTTRLGFDVEGDLGESEFGQEVLDVLHESASAYETILTSHGPSVAEYVVPFAALQNYGMDMSAREVYWMVELRTGSQGRPHYREVCQQMADVVIKVHPFLFSHMKVDRNTHPLSRREAVIRAGKKKREREGKRQRPHGT